MSSLEWIDVTFRAARLPVLTALLRHFDSLETAEEAFQEACLRALQKWPDHGPPRDAAAWLIFVGKNATLDAARRQNKQRELPSDEALSDLGDAEASIAERLDDAHYRDDSLRLLFICCHPVLPATQRIALALRVVCGLSVGQIARAFLVSDSAMEQRITRAKSRVSAADLRFEPPGEAERRERIASVTKAIYLMFNAGYSASGESAPLRVPLCDEAIRLGRVLLGVAPNEPEILGLVALMLLQHARTPARLDASGEAVLLEEQDRTRWDRLLIDEGLALRESASWHGREGPYQVQAAIAAHHAVAADADDTDWMEIEGLYARLEALQPSPVATLNRAVVTSRVRGAEVALSVLEPLASELSTYFYFFGVRGALLMQLGRLDEARRAFDRAIALASTPMEASHIRSQLDRLAQESRASRRASTRS